MSTSLLFQKKEMKTLNCLLMLLGALLLSPTAAAEKVFVLPVEREIDMQAFYHLRSGLNRATENGADLVVLKLNTFGGALDAADSMRTALRRCPLPTVAFVDPNAASAGALIALSCDSVFMSPQASMGSATVVNGSGEPMPEKYQQYMRAIMRATAESHGRDAAGQWRRNPAIADSMVRPDCSISLTATQALSCGFSQGTAVSVHQVLEELDVSTPEIVTYKPSLTDEILGFLASAGVRAILITLILGAIYMEMHTPGLGFAAAVACVATVLFFLPMLVSGTLSAWVILCFIAGVILVALEVFVIPGFGVCGVAGGLAIIVSLAGAIMENDSITGFDLTGAFRALMIILAGGAMAVGIALWLTGKHGPKALRKHTELLTELRNDEGFIGVETDVARFVGHQAVTLTPLRPVGKIEIAHHPAPLSAISENAEYIDAGEKVKITRFENAQLYVVKS